MTSYWQLLGLYYIFRMLKQPSYDASQTYSGMTNIMKTNITFVQRSAT